MNNNVARRENMNKNILLCVGIVILFLGVAVAPLTQGIVDEFIYKEEKFDIIAENKMVFKTLGGNNSPPYCPSNYTPCGGLPVDVDINLSWDGGDPDPEDTVSYDVYLGQEAPPPPVTTVGPYPANQTRIEYDPGTLEICEQYYWKIVAWDNHGALTMGSICSFYTICENYPPDAPSKPSGNTSGYICIDHNYSASTTDPNGLNISYGWDWDGDLSVDEWTDWYESNETCTIAHNWSDPGDYNISVKAKNTLEVESNWSTQLSITMLNHPPYPPRKPTPLDGASNVSGDAILCWIGGDPDICDTVTYDVFFSINYPPIYVSLNQTETCYDPYGTADMPIFEEYYWRVVAWDNHGAFISGPVWSFKTGINYTQYEIEIDGPTRGRPGITYCYNITIDDYDGDNLWIEIDWDDGTQQNEWYEPDQNITVCHCWEEKGTYFIRAIAEDVYGALLAEGRLMVNIPRIRISVNSLFFQLLDRFPLLERLLSLIRVI